jgi:hypothetical protein
MLTVRQFRDDDRGFSLRAAADREAAGNRPSFGACGEGQWHRGSGHSVATDDA